MPKGELSPVRNSVLISATPSPFASRSSVMRLADGTTDPALVMNFFMIAPRIPLPSSGRGGAAVSATSTSPLGRVYSQRGCCRSAGEGIDRDARGAVGFMPGGQPLASATCTTGMVFFSGAGSAGSDPTVVPGEVTGAWSVGPTVQAVPAARIADSQDRCEK